MNYCNMPQEVADAVRRHRAANENGSYLFNVDGQIYGFVRHGEYIGSGPADLVTSQYRQVVDPEHNNHRGCLTGFGVISRYDSERRVIWRPTDKPGVEPERIIDEAVTLATVMNREILFELHGTPIRLPPGIEYFEAFAAYTESQMSGKYAVEFPCRPLPLRYSHAPRLSSPVLRDVIGDDDTHGDSGPTGWMPRRNAPSEPRQQEAARAKRELNL